MAASRAVASGEEAGKKFNLHRCHVHIEFIKLGLHNRFTRTPLKLYNVQKHLLFVWR